LAVIIKGKSVGGAKRLAVHLMRTDTNERAEVKELRGVAAEDLRGALLEMEAVASGTRTTKPFYHGSINTRADERLTDEQRLHAIDRLEAALGLTGQARTIVVHEKEGREHCHIVWSRIDLERMAAISDSHNYRKHEEVARALEREFGHERVQGAHVERDGKERPERTPSHAEMLQADRTGLSANEVKEQITELWRGTDNGKDFFVALWQAGYELARGDRRDYVVIDPRGGTHSLARRVEGAKVKDIRERMADLDPARIPNIADAKQIQRARQERDAERDRQGKQPPESVRVDEEERSKRHTPDGLEWTNRAGMVHQQRAAMDWVKASQEQKDSRTEQTDRRRETSDAEAARKEYRQALLREFGREFSDEEAHDLDSGRERTRR
jgi:hypothetical protein